jgi:ATP synthase F1 gamma subunit
VATPTCRCSFSAKSRRSASWSSPRIAACAVRYNSNLLFALRKQVDELQAAGKKVKFWCYGRKGYAWLTRRGYEVERFFVEPPLDKADFSAARLVGKALVEAFESGMVDEARLFYTRFQSMIKFVPTNAPFLPIASIAVGQAKKQNFELDFLLEPDATTVFNRLMPRYLETVVFDAMLQALASEHASRRMAMKGATDAAAHEQGPEEGLQPRASGEHHEGAARHHRRRQCRQLTDPRSLTP